MLSSFKCRDIAEVLSLGIGNIHATVGCDPPDEMSPIRARFPVYRPPVLDKCFPPSWQSNARDRRCQDVCSTLQAYVPKLVAPASPWFLASDSCRNFSYACSAEREPPTGRICERGSRPPKQATPRSMLSCHRSEVSTMDMPPGR